jgi:hypothetical protein
MRSESSSRSRRGSFWLAWGLLASAAFLGGCPIDSLIDGAADGGSRDSSPVLEAGRRDVTSVSSDAPRAAPDGRATGFCASQTPPDAIAYFCDDFDEDADASVIGALESSQGSLAVVSSVSYSRPRSLLATANPSSGGWGNAFYLRSLSSGHTFTLSCEVLLDAVGNDTSGTALVSLDFNGADGVIASVMLSATSTGAGSAAIGVGEEDPAGGSTTTYVPHSNRSAVSTSVWTSLVLTVVAGGGYVDTVLVNGAPLEASYPLASNFFTQGPQAAVGITYATESAQVYFDNVVVTVQ